MDNLAALTVAADKVLVLLMASPPAQTILVAGGGIGGVPRRGAGSAPNWTGAIKWYWSTGTGLHPRRVVLAG